MNATNCGSNNVWSDDSKGWAMRSHSNRSLLDLRGLHFHSTTDINSLSLSKYQTIRIILQPRLVMKMSRIASRKK
jgi:hypothetical protein